MSDIFSFEGTYQITPSLSSSTEFQISPGRIDATMAAGKKLAQTYDLTADAVQAVALADLASTGAHALIIKADNNITLTVTSAAGAAQVLAGHQFFIFSVDNPYTAISVQRDSGVSTRVEITMAQLA